MSRRDQRDSSTERNWVRWALYGLIGLFFLVAVPVTITKVVGRSALRTQLQRIRDAGQPISFAEWRARLPALPDDENSMRVLDELKDRLDALEAPASDWRDVPHIGKSKLPPWSDPFPTKTFDSIKRFLDEHDDLVRRLDAVHEMPHGRIDTDPQTDLFWISLGRVRTAAKVEALAVLRDAAESHPDAACLRCVTVTNIGASLAGGPGLIYFLIRVAINRLTIDTVERALSFVEMSSKSLFTIEEILRECEVTYDLRGELHGERLLQISIHESMRRGEVDALVDLGSRGLELSTRMSWAFSGLMDWNLAKSLELTGDLIDGADSPRHAIAAAKTYDGQAANLPAPYFLSRMLLPSLSRYCELFATHIANLRCARVGLAAERFRMERHRWPAELSELVPDFSDVLPVDPFDEQPLRYKIEPDRITIYSIGVNRIDDGGDVARPPDRSSRTPDVGFRLLNPDRRGFQTIDPPAGDNGVAPVSNR